MRLILLHLRILLLGGLLTFPGAGYSSTEEKSQAFELRGTSSGYIRLNAGASPTNPTFTLPSVDGGAGDILRSDGSGVLSFVAQRGVFNLLWHLEGPDAAILEAESDIGIPVIKFPNPQALGQNLFTRSMIKVPANYTAGNQIIMKLPMYGACSSPSDVDLEITMTLLQPGTDVVSSTTDQRTQNPTYTCGSSNKTLQMVNVLVTDSSGQINSVTVQPSNFILLKLKHRGLVADPTDMWLFQGGTEVRFE